MQRDLASERTHSAVLAGAAESLSAEKADLERRLHDLEQRSERGALLHGFAEAATGALWVADASTGEGRYVSPGLETLMEVSVGNVLPHAGRWLHLVHADDRPSVAKRFESVRQGETAEIEYRVLLPAREGDISRRSRWVRDLGFPVRTGSRVRYVAGFVSDAADRQGKTGLRRLLLAELNHRVRNTLAAVHSLAAQTARAAPSPAAFWSVFAGRLLALARAHDRLSEGGWTAGADLRALLETELSPFLATAGPAAGPRAALVGPDVQLEPGTAISFALALHEMVTNAVRHGALSASEGEVHVHWRIIEPPLHRGNADRPWLRIEWRERGGPALSGPPTMRGFGTRLLERNLPRQLGGQVELQFPTEGLVAVITVPLRRV
ncbi:HWE histidine kinase domain-containing protein [Roseicella sp. DB1501]|uniref:sensor histidine kinase n=1 Tax=Roseicella sp. DB1501 TaxID=2730925 RepID=UPI001492D0CD|nr:PAS domain-containing protein [Roseicella sp. DB1501]